MKSTQSKENIESLFFDLSPDLLAVSRDGVFIHLNKSWERLLGWSIDELKSKEVYQFIHPDDYNPTYKIVVSPEITNNIIIENRYRCKNGDYIWLAWTAFKKEGLIYGIARDITEKKQKDWELNETVKDLEKTNKDLERFAYIVSHDLKAPVRGINVLARWILEDKEKSHYKATEYASMIEGRAIYLTEMINGILEYSKIGRKEIRKEKVGIRMLLENLCASLVSSPNVKIRVMMDDIHIYGSKVLFAQVFSNLISNAIKHNNKSECLIYVKGKEENGFYTFEVEDNGPGIPAEAQKEIFEIFKTLHTENKDESTGVGLSIVRKIIEDQFKGKVWVESESGSGTKFIFSWKKEDSPDQP
ncbi:MAG TPA: PAS domain-containing sensor histidine kinase [Cytophagaceae bacterium]|jgi:PAS domain S-box-containing protein|nr:PAS domain-containing sensor histidine kinase [Cytophagaceae bacterium]